MVRPLCRTRWLQVLCGPGKQTFLPNFILGQEASKGETRSRAGLAFLRPLNRVILVSYRHPTHTHTCARTPTPAAAAANQSVKAQTAERHEQRSVPIPDEIHSAPSLQPTFHLENSRT